MTDLKIEQYISNKGFHGVKDFKKEDLPSLREYLVYTKAFLSSNTSIVDKLEMAIAVLTGGSVK